MGFVNNGEGPPPDTKGVGDYSVHRYPKLYGKVHHPILEGPGNSSPPWDTERNR